MTRGARLSVLYLLALVGAVTAAPLQVCDDVVPPRNLNPLRVFEWKPDALLSHIYEGLLGFDPEGNVVGRLARDWRWVDARTLELDLVEDARFHDGSRLDATVVAANFAYLRGQGPECPRCPLFSTVEEARVLAEDRVALRLAREDGTLLHKLAAFSWMLPEHLLDAEGMARLESHPVGAGPYRFAGWRDGAMRLEAFPDYHGGPPAFPDGLSWHFLPEGQQIRRVARGELDLLGRVRPFYHAKIQGLPGVRLLKADTLIELGLVFNTESEPVSDPAVRRAISRAIHVEDLIRYVARGNARPMRGSGMPGQLGHDPEAPAHRFDPTAARAFFSKRPPLRLRGLLDPEYTLLGRALVAQLEKVGVHLELEEVSRDELFERVALPRLSGEGRWRDDLFVYSCPDPTYHYAFVNSLSPYGSGLWSTWDSPTYDALFERMLGVRDPEVLRGYTRKLDAIVAREVPKIELYQVRKGYAVRSTLDFRPTRSGMLDLRYSSWGEAPEAGAPRRTMGTP